MNRIDSTNVKGPSFEVRSIEWMQTNREYLDKPGRHSSFQIVWIMQGDGHFCIDMERYSLNSDTIYFIPAGRAQQIRPTGNITGYVISFNEDLFHLAIACPSQSLYDEMTTGFSRVNLVTIRDKKTERLLTNVLQEMIQEFEEFLMLRSEILSGLLKIFLIYIRRMSIPLPYEITPSKVISLFNNFYSRLDKYFLTKRFVADYADELSVTPSYLTEVAKRVTGFSASHHIQQRRVLEAKRLAIYSGESMKAIAYKLGFEDVSHFSKFFKNVTGVNFSDFKKNGQLADSPINSPIPSFQ